MNDPFDDPETLRWTEQKQRPISSAERDLATPKLPRPGKGEPYLGGPIPLDWITAAVQLPGKAWIVGTALWFVGVRTRSKSAVVQITRKTLLRFGLTRLSVYRSLVHLENAGLVRVHRLNGRRLSVTILPAPEKVSSGLTIEGQANE